MAIRRCPYCKAIIDDGSEYCSNCGTQLIFPEDEFVEEEIPGEKIIDVNEDVAEP
ncbi:MAG: zinc-ribbon domain-containing protein, partial [Candidatus Aminicenantes bacterium]|nr:zinc-ribbon domain-containing protein [Candidatus Aminicenantes bacterium]